jgi:hypothetical protein
MWLPVPGTGWRGMYFLPGTTGVSKDVSHMIALASGPEPTTGRQLLIVPNTLALCAYSFPQKLWGVGNKIVTSKCGYRYQRLDGEACISCPRQQMSATSKVTWFPWLRAGTDHRTATSNCLYCALVDSSRWIYARCVFEIYRGTSV